MSTRRSSSSGEGLPSSRCGERTPLRSLDNEMLHLSTPSSRFKSKSLLSADVKTTKGDVPLCAPECHLQSPPSTNMIQTNASSIDVAACGLGDVTFKSFICAGGEVEIAGSSMCAEESIILPKDQAVQNTCQAEDTVISDSMIVQSCGDHVEHPYHNLETIDASRGDINDDLDDKRAAQDLRVFQHDVTWKSFVCDGGEVEVCDVTRLQDETIPLPKAQLDKALQDNSLNSTNLSVCGQPCQEEHADHPYCSGGAGVHVIATFSQTTNGFEEPANALSDITFKSFNCTGGEVQISDGTRLADETVPLPADQTAACSESFSYGTDPSMLANDQNVQKCDDRFDHPYCNIESFPSSLSGNIAITQEPIPFSLDGMDEVKQISLVVPDSQTGRQESITFSSLISARVDAEVSDDTQMSQKTSALPDNHAVMCQSLDDTSVPTSVTQDHIQDHSEQPNTLHRSESALSAETPTPVDVHLEHVSQVHNGSGPPESSEAKDSALGSSGNVPVLCNSAEKPNANHLPDVLKVLSECHSVASALQIGLLSPVVRRASLFALKAHKGPLVDQFLADDSALEDEKSLVAPVNIDPTGLWAENLESPMPRPLFNSTVVGCRAQTVEDVGVGPCAEPQPEVEKPVLDIPLIPDGPLQQQLRQMAEFLFLASGKMGPTAASAPVFPTAANTVPSTRTAPAESHSVCVGTSPIKRVEHSVNTSGQFERKREFSVVDSCTLTDPLLWNVPPGSLEGLPRQELEQRLRSSMIMVEALVQQLATARIHGRPSVGPAPSDLREKLVQTDHTELSQTTLHRDLYLEALSRISELELDGSSLQNLIQCMQDMRANMTTLSCDTDAALLNMRKIGDVVREDHQSLVSHYGQMKSLFEKTKETQTVMMQKVKDALHQRDEMRAGMEEAFTAREAAFSVCEQLRTHSATEISELERIVGSQQELLAALNQTYPEQVALNQAYNEALNSASDVLSTTIEEQSSLMKELCRVRGLLQGTAPILLGLNEKAAAALRERDEHISARNQAVEERDQIEEEWNQTNLNLQTAREQIGDLNLQVTILTSEMGVLRQKLTERDEERGQLERKVTELSATVSSTLASYTFLEQALGAETTKLQQSWKDIQQANDRGNELEASLGQSEQQVSELSQALAQSEEQLSQLQVLTQSQNSEIQQLQDLCTQLSGVREMNEFLQMENELAREQMSESECMLRANLQGLRERNIQCEDLKGELGQLQLENRSLQEQLETTRSKASETQLELEEKLAQAVTEITLLHHTLRGLTNELHAALKDQKPEPPKDKQSQSIHSVERRHPSSSFVDSIMVALTSEKEEDVNTEDTSWTRHA
ncbi:hypothetical protein D5F01_LYC00414 [Larimichthys crocea]|uniref:Sperm-associated antigen 5 n=1 Tax=Larimichthys crocea TaxID=215358 RepID=A0A6G0J9K2_LARCR|nr:hypothetical protein D5F01_LYC00414 [Larimichthys crocea]